MIQAITDRNLDAFLNQDLSTLILARSTCNRCISYIGEVRSMIERGTLGPAAIGVLYLDQPGVSQFKRENLWLMNTEFLPYTVIYRNGQRVDGFSASRGHFLLDHSRRSAAREQALAITR